MFISRGALLGRTLFKLATRQSLKPVNIQSVRNSGHFFNYRSGPPPPSQATKYGAEIVAALMWWWVLYHLITEYEHITGEFDYPDVEGWTNAELGIPEN